MRRPGAAGESGESGTISVEMVILAVVIVVAMALGSGAGILVLADGRVGAAAAAAARAASQQSQPRAAAIAARQAAESTLRQAGTSCTPEVSIDTSQFEPGGVVEVRVRCRVDLSVASLAGFPAHRDLSATARAPLEQHRSYGGPP